LAPHVSRCRCAACEEPRKRAVLARQAERRQGYSPGSADPERRYGWAAAEHRLAEWITMHKVEMDHKLHVTQLDLKPTFVAHLDGEIGERSMDAGLLHEALCVVESMADPIGLRGRLVRGRAIERMTGVQMAEREHMSEAAISRNLDAGLDLVLQVYGGLVLAEQRRAAG
jgi:hypothetical protein